MRKKAARMMCISMTCLILCSFSGKVYASTISEIRRQQEEDKKKLNNVQGQISGLQGEQSEIGAEIVEIDAELVQIIASVDLIKEEIVEKENQIKETEAEYETAKQQEETQYETMKIRIKFMYEQGDISYMQLFLSSESFSDMLNKADYVEQLYAYDRKMLEEYKAAKDYVQQVWDRLEEEQSYMEELLEEKKQEYENYNVQIARAKQEAAAYRTRIKQQTAQIKKLEEEERKRREEEERKRKEEEERRRMEAEANNSSGESNSQPSESSSSSSSSSSGGSSNVASGGSAAGQSIASYACQFIGNPYVAGGTSLTNGADCSGFVWRVFKDKGYTVPRTSWELRNVGTEVSYSNAQPGDIICYAGHVGIYIGNGNIVHASTPKSGIKITTATYKSILSVRRVA